MGQREIINLLEGFRSKGKEGYYSSNEIKKMLDNLGQGASIISISKNLSQLKYYGLIEFKVEGVRGIHYYRGRK